MPANTAPMPQIRLATAMEDENGSTPMASVVVTGVR